MSLTPNGRGADGDAQAQQPASTPAHSARPQPSAPFVHPGESGTSWPGGQPGQYPVQPPQQAYLAEPPYPPQSGGWPQSAAQPPSPPQSGGWPQSAAQPPSPPQSGGWPQSAAQPSFTLGAGPSAGHPWLPQQPVAKPSVLPVEPREYHEFLRTPAMRWWRPIAALTMSAAIWFVVNILAGGLAMGYDLSVGNTTWADYSNLDRFKTTPALFLANNLALASAIPIAALTQWACFGQRPRWLPSVVGGFRWRWCFECVAWLLPLYLLSLLIDLVLWGPPTIQVTASTGFMIAAILLTTPLQAAGEEYLLRGLGQRAIGAWLPRTAGLVISTAVTAVIFMLLHGAGDPWLNAFYLLFAVTASVLAWRTGGLEAAIALHAVNNVVSMTFLPFTDISNMFDREAGVGSPWILVQMAIMLGGAALVLWRAKRRNVVTMAAPGAPQAAPTWQSHHPPQADPPQQPWRRNDAEQTR